MVFEEFFLKKKIDLAQFKDADPGLLEQFRNHYSLMGEKSFDHTKKYWFNKLRHEYPLSAEEETRLKELFKGDKNVPKSEAVVETPNTEVAVAKPAGFRPKFKTPVTSSASPEEKGTESETTNPEVAPKPTGFKPRFKAGVSSTAPTESNKNEGLPPKKIDADQEKETGSETTNLEVAPKPAGFKPRFKAGVSSTAPTESNKNERLPPKKINADQEKESASETTNPEVAPKPLGFKPRFKAGVTSTAPEKSAKDEELPPKKIDADQEKESTSETTNPEGAPKPLGFKPRFKAGITSTAPEKSVKDEELPPKKIDVDQEKEIKSETTNLEVAPKPLGFKPRFKAGVTSTAPKESANNEELPPKEIDADQEKETGSETTNLEVAPKPLGFKPRFKKPSE